MNKLNQAIYSDCTRLIEMFASNNSKEFTNFCKEWKRMHFQHMYSGLVRGTEIIKITDEIFASAKRIFFGDKSDLQRIGAIYLMYAIYFKQPTQEHCKISVTYSQWNSLKEFVQSKSDDPDTLQVRYIFWKMLKSNAFRFVESDIVYGLEVSFSRDWAPEDETEQTNSLASIVKNELNEINHSTSGMLESLDMLEDGYNEMKEIMNGLNKESNSIQKIDPSNIVAQLKESVNKIQSILNGESDDDEDEDQEMESKSNIFTRRENLKKAAFKKSKRSRAQDIEYDITVAGDMIHMTKNNSTCARRKKGDTISDLLKQKLPQETLFELSNIEHIDDN